MHQSVLAVDAGQTGVRLRLHTPSGPAGTHGHEAQAEIEFPGVRTAEPLAPQLAGMAASVLLRAGQDPAAITLAIGTSGVADVPGLSTALRLELGGTGTGPERIIVAHDSVTSYLGALGDASGVVVAAGTGAIIFGVGAERTARVDGWGYLMGDDGSGYSVGAQGWRAVMRHHDGRGPATALTEDFRTDFPDLEAAYVEIQADADRVRRMASYSRRVTALAATDQVARGIAQWAGQELAASVATAAARVGLTEGVSVARLGKVLTDPTVDAAFREALAAHLPRAVLVEPQGTGLDGAALLASLAPGSAVDAAVAHA